MVFDPSSEYELELEFDRDDSDLAHLDVLPLPEPPRAWWPYAIALSVASIVVGVASLGGADAATPVPAPIARVSLPSVSEPIAAPAPAPVPAPVPAADPPAPTPAPTKLVLARTAPPPPPRPIDAAASAARDAAMVEYQRVGHELLAAHGDAVAELSADFHALDLDAELATAEGRAHVTAALAAIHDRLNRL